jgi:hypothetical protein
MGYGDIYSKQEEKQLQGRSEKEEHLQGMR